MPYPDAETLCYKHLFKEPTRTQSRGVKRYRARQRAAFWTGILGIVMPPLWLLTVYFCAKNAGSTSPWVCDRCHSFTLEEKNCECGHERGNNNNNNNNNNTPLRTMKCRALVAVRTDAFHRPIGNIFCNAKTEVY